MFCTYSGKTAEEAAGAAVKARNLTAEDFSREDYKWAYSIITTRAIFPGLLTEQERDGDVPLVVLGPLSDRFFFPRVFSPPPFFPFQNQVSFFNPLSPPPFPPHSLFPPFPFPALPLFFPFQNRISFLFFSFTWVSGR